MIKALRPCYTATLLALATIAVVLRLFSRKLSSASYWWDGWTIMAALVISNFVILTSLKHFLDSLT